MSAGGPDENRGERGAGRADERASEGAVGGAHARYVIVVLVLLGLFCGGVAAFNVAVDPFRAFRLPPSEARFERAWLGTRRVSKGEVLRHGEARVLLLGTSRVECGFDPAHPAWGSADVYNMGLGATNLWEVTRVFRYAARHEPLEHVVLSLDMLMFNSNRQSEWDFRQSLFNERRRYPEYRLGTVLSKYAIESSRRVLEREREGASDWTDDRGFLHKPMWPGFDYRGVSMGLLRGFMTNPKSYGPYTDDGSRWALLQEILETCAARGIRLTIVLPPSHALDMEMLWVSGNWEAFEHWKRRIVSMVEAHEEVSGARVTIWDFTTHAGRNAEALPGPVDPATGRRAGEQQIMVDWLETSHFTRAYGDDMIEAIMGEQARPASGGAEGAAIGVRLTSDTLEAHLERLRGDRAWYVRAFSADARQVAALWSRVEGSRGGERE